LDFLSKAHAKSAVGGEFHPFKIISVY